MNYLFALSLLSSVLFVHARCPVGTVQGVNAADCYLINGTPAVWQKAEDSCIRQGGHLTSVSSAIGNAVLRQMIGLSSAKEFWLGGSYTKSKGQWTWTDGRRFTYTNWAAGQPLNRDKYCIAMDVASGSWSSRLCSTAKPFVCKVPPQGGASTTASPTPTRSPGWCKPGSSDKCPVGWTYVASVEGKCLRITDHQDNWHNSRATCKQWGGDLVSVHSDISNRALLKFSTTRIGESAFSIGLQKPTSNSQWQWTDGSPVNYTNWESGFGNRQSPTITLMDNNDGTWEDIPVPEDNQNPNWRGICETCPS